MCVFENCEQAVPLRVRDWEVMLNWCTLSVSAPAEGLTPVPARNPSDLGQSTMKVERGKILEFEF